jgi:hypothetical protein
MLRQVDATPPKGMDLITFYREREAQQNTEAKGA